MNPNAYVELAIESLRDLVGLAEVDAPEALDEAQALWGLLAWADGRIDPHERAVFAALAAEARAHGVPPPLPVPADDLSGRPLPGFLGRAAAEGLRGGRRAGRIANALESFGYGLLAADAEIREEEHAALKAYMGDLRAGIAAARDAARSPVAAGVG